MSEDEKPLESPKPIEKKPSLISRAISGGILAVMGGGAGLAVNSWAPNAQERSNTIQVEEHGRAIIRVEERVDRLEKKVESRLDDIYDYMQENRRRRR